MARNDIENIVRLGFELHDVHDGVQVADLNRIEADMGTLRQDQPERLKMMGLFASALGYLATEEARNGNMVDFRITRTIGEDGKPSVSIEIG